jgi:multiple sugar transport system substrate-binding protein
MHRRALAAVGGLVVAIATLSACGGGGSSTSTSSGSATQAKKASKIVFAGWGREEAASKPIFDSFLTSFGRSSGAKVSWEGWPYDQTQQQLVLRLKAKQAPNVAQLDMNWVTTFAKQGALMDLNQVFGKQKLESEFPENYLKLGQRDGVQVALPWTTASISLVANKAVLRKAGITTMPTTTAEFAADLAKIKQREPDVIPYALNTKTPALVTPFFLPWMWTFGGTLVDNGKIAVNSPGTQRALAYLSGLVSKGLIAKDVDIFAARKLFAQGKVAFYDDAIIAKSVAVATNHDTKFGDDVVPVARPVAAAGDAPQSVQWGHVLVMFKEPNAGAARTSADFVNYLEDPATAIRYFKDQGLLPATKRGLDAPEVKQDTYSSTWAQITATSRLDETAPYVNGAKISEIVGQYAEAAYLGQKSPAAATQAMANDLGQVELK